MAGLDTLDRAPLGDGPHPAVDGLQQLRDAITRADDLRRQLADTGDWQSLAFGMAAIRTLSRDLAALARDIEDDVARLLPDRRVELEGLGVLERRKSSDRKRWQSDEILDRIIRDTGLDPATGELLSHEDHFGAFLAVLREAVPFTGSLAWRVSALRALGLDPDEWCESTPGRTTVQITGPGQ